MKTIHLSRSGKEVVRGKWETEAGWLTLLTVFVVLILPQHLSAPLDLIVATVGAAVLFTVQVCLMPSAFRSRGGSMVPAYLLSGFVWVAAIVVTVLSFISRS